MPSRDVEELVFAARVKLKAFLAAAKAAGLDVLVTCVNRTDEEQDELYAQGRTTPGHIVTRARGGDSFHNHGCAIDVVIMDHGKPQWQVFSPKGTMLPNWKQLGAIAVANGVEWAGNWHDFHEYAHFQYTGGLSIEDLKSGKVIT